MFQAAGILLSIILMDWYAILGDELSLTNAISTMINMPHAKRLELGINARSLVKRKFDEKIVISKTLEPLFQSMTNK